MTKENNYAYIAIVAIVAVVALVVLISGGSNKITLDNNDLVGQAASGDICYKDACASGAECDEGYYCISDDCCKSGAKAAALD